MKRFEYKDQKSDKFWEIEQEELSLHTCWGRIGTNGQRKTKEYASEEKAQAAMKKLIDEKIAKGYVEVETNNKTIKKALPQEEKEKPVANKEKKALKTSSEVQQKIDSPVEKTEKTDLYINTENAPWLLNQPTYSIPSEKNWATPLPTRNNPQHIKNFSEKDFLTWNEIKKHNLSSFYFSNKSSSASLHDAVEEAQKRLEASIFNPKGSRESNIILMAFALSDKDHYSRLDIAQNHIFNSFYDALDLKSFIQLFLDAEKIDATFQYHYKKENSCITFEDSPQDIIKSPSYQGMILTEAEEAVCQMLSTSTEEEWTECVKMISDQIDTFPPARQAIIALVVPDCTELSHQVAKTLLSLPKVPFTAKGLMVSVTDPTLLEELAKTKVVFPDSYDSYYHTEILDCEKFISTLLLEKKEEALDLLLPKINTPYVGLLIAHINHPKAIQALAIASQKGEKTNIANFHTAIANWPVAAIVGLTELFVKNKKDYAFIRSTLLNLCHQFPNETHSLLTWFNPDITEVLNTLLSASTQMGEADITNLPNFLVTPPWTIKRPKKEIKIFDLTPLKLDAVSKQKGNKKSTPTRYNASADQKQATKNLSYLMGQLGFDNRNAKELELIGAAVHAIKANDLEELLKVFDLFLAHIKEVKTQKKYGYWIRINCDILTILPDEMAISIFNQYVSKYDSIYDEKVVITKYGLDVLPGVISLIKRLPTDYIDLAESFTSVELAPIMARAFHKLKTLKEEGRAWLLENPKHAVYGLIPSALGKKGEARDCATAALRFLDKNGHNSLILETAKLYQDEEIVIAINELLNESELDLFPTKIPSLPSFWQPATWRRPILVSGVDAGKGLPISAIDHLGTMLAFPTPEGWYAGLTEIKALCTLESLADFSWDLFNTWLNHAAPSKEKWAFLSLGVFGNDDIARRITPYIREWPGMSAHARAVMGLDVLAEIGSDVALMQLNGIAQKVKFKGLQDKAREKIEEIAEKLGLTREELEDRLAPDFGLDEQGTLKLDFGSRQFTVGFDEALKPYIRDDKGKRMANLPKPNKSDDEVLAKEATDRFKGLKKDVRTVASQQVTRLEQAMCTRRRWSIENFEQFIAQHPLVRYLASRLVWATYEMTPDKKGNIQNYGGNALSFFRISEDSSYTTAEDEEFQIPQQDNIRIGIPHILETPDEVGVDFGQLFTDYELIQPFAQLGRETFSLTEKEKELTELTRWKTIEIPTGRVISLINKGWRKGTPQDAGWIGLMHKDIGNNNSIELHMDEGYCVGYTEMSEPQKIETIIIGKNHSNWDEVEKPFILGTVDSIIMSELIRDMELLTKKTD